jgi:putative RNA-binding protein, YhbY family
MLSSKQKKYLKSQANRLRPLTQIGKNGVNEAVIEDLKQALATRELIKVNLLQNADVSVAEVVAALADLPKIEVIQHLGRVITIYRPNNKEKYQRLSTEVNKIK